MNRERFFFSARFSFLFPLFYIQQSQRRSSLLPPNSFSSLQCVCNAKDREVKSKPNALFFF